MHLSGGAMATLGDGGSGSDGSGADSTGGLGRLVAGVPGPVPGLPWFPGDEPVPVGCGPSRVLVLTGPGDGKGTATTG